MTHGVELVGQTGNALREIVTQIGNISNLVSEIAASTQEQATGLHQINTAVNQMDQMTQQNAAMVEETTASSFGLANEASQLQTLLRRFRLDNDTAPEKAMPVSANERHNRRPRPVARR